MPEQQRRFELHPRHGRYDRDGYYRVSDYELMTGWVSGIRPEPPAENQPAPVGTPRAGFEAALLPALQRPPCVVAFSGGRDSSAVLCVATHLARREGLPEPIPVTHDFSGQGIADETRYQELVVRRLGLTNWQRVADPDTFDVLGERATAGLRRHGLLWPALLHSHTALAELTPGGSLVVGEGGDEVLGNQRMTAVTHLLKRRHRAGLSALPLLYRALAPRPLRRHSLRRELDVGPMHPWLAPELAAEFVADLARDQALAPLRWDRAVLRFPRQRSVVTGAANMRRVLATLDVTYHEPFLHPDFLRPFAAAGGRRGFFTRTSLMRMLFGDVVPDEICCREEKARFGAVAVGERSRSFLEGWTGTGIDPDVVDIEAFRAAVRAESPLYGTLLLLQAAWLATTEPAVAEPAR